MSADQESERGQVSSSSSRKRPLPASLLNEEEAPPNKRIHIPTEEEKEAIMKEKQNLYKRLLDEKNPLYMTSMFPFIPRFSPVSPMYPFLQQQQQQPSSVPLGASSSVPLGNGSTVSSTLNITGIPTPGGSSAGSLTPPRPSLGPTGLLKYPFSPPTPSSFSSLSLLSPWSVDTAKTASPKGRDEQKTSPNPKKPTVGLNQASSILSALQVNQFLPSGQSPLNYLQHSSPVSPMMYLNSPYPQSISSVPSVSSSSGCSSSSEGVPGSVGSLNHSYAPTEYHVGPRRPLIHKITQELDCQSESPSNSGRNTPIDVEETSTVPSGVDGATIVRRLAEVNRHKSGTDVHEVISLQCGGQQRGECSAANSQSYVSHLVDRPSSGVSSMSSSASSRDSTPEAVDIKPLTHFGADKFCTVPGRLSLLSSTQKYDVSVEEVRRRLSHPECLNASVLGGILRRAKSKNGGNVLRQRLESIGVSLPPGRRKATELSLFTSLVEGEAHTLAKDFHRLCDSSFPCPELAQFIASQHVGTPEAQHRISMVKATQLILNELQAMVNAVPYNASPNDPSNLYPGLVNFSLLTHGFGNPAVNASLSVVQNYLKELLNYYEGVKPIQPTQRYPQPEQRNLHKPYTCSSDRNRSGLFVCLKQEPSD